MVKYITPWEVVNGMWAADEIFLGRSPLLLVVEPGSLLLGGLRLAERTVAEWCRLGDLFTQVRRAFDLVTPEGDLNTAAQAQATFATVLAATLRPVEDPRFFAHLDALPDRLSALRLEQVGPDREARLARLVAETVAWRRRDKPPGRGSVREGHSPAELAGIELPTPDWIELLAPAAPVEAAPLPQEVAPTAGATEAPEAPGAPDRRRARTAA